MPILRPSEPLTPFQRSLNKGVVLLLAAVGIGLGMWQAKECAAERFGYIAGYSYAAALLLAIGLSVIGLLLLIYWRTRSVGAGLVAAGILSCAVFYAGMAVLLKEDRVAWRHEPAPVSIGPDARASAVIYFRKGITAQQVEDFDSSVLEEPAQPGYEGRGHPPFVQEYLHLAPSQANGHEAIALTFFDNAPSDKVNAYMATIGADRRVEAVFLDVAPNSIQSVSEHPKPVH
jgi:hypothetical protein